MTKTLADLLRIQEHYYLLHDGTRYARHGTAKANGLLVFESRERADEFRRTVGVGLPAFKAKRVGALELLRLAEEMGAICVADGLKVVVGTIREDVNHDQ